MKVSGEAASADVAVAEEYPSKFKRLVDEGIYHPDLVFNVDETGLYWKRLPSRTYIACEERFAPWFQGCKRSVDIASGWQCIGNL